jgi:hypothetical protein
VTPPCPSAPISAPPASVTARWLPYTVVNREKPQKVAIAKNLRSILVRIVGVTVSIARGGWCDLETARRIHPEVAFRANLSHRNAALSDT